MPADESYKPHGMVNPYPVDYSQKLSVSIAEIDEQRRKGWSDFHPEKYCHRCGGLNVRSWFVDSDRFNAAFGDPTEHPYNGIVCPGCFVAEHERRTGLQTTWRLIPDGPFRPVPFPQTNKDADAQTQS